MTDAASGGLVRRALYFPEWGVSDAAFMAQALMYWDTLACIVPVHGFTPMPQFVADQDMSRVLQELNRDFVQGLTPSPEQKGRVHDRLAAMIDVEAPHPLQVRHLDNAATNIASEKLSWKTIDLLQRNGWARTEVRDAGEFTVVHQLTAQMVMHSLAVELSSSALPSVTARPVAFEAHRAQFLGLVGATPVAESSEPIPADDAASLEALVVLPLETLTFAPRDITPGLLLRLWSLRNDAEWEVRRRSFTARMDAYVAGVRDLAGTDAVRLPLEELRRDLDRDREALARELRRARVEAVATRETWFSFAFGGVLSALGLATIGAIAAPTLLAAGCGLYWSYRRSRNEALAGHWTAWLMRAAG